MESIGDSLHALFKFLIGVIIALIAVIVVLLVIVL